MSLSLSRFDSPRTARSRGAASFFVAVDYPLLLTILAVVGFGLVVLYSAAGGAAGESASAMLRQGIRLGAGFAVFFVMAQIQPRYFRLWTPWVYLGVVVLLIMVMVAGDVGGGAQRWLDFGLFSVQPSEFMKLAVPMMVAWYLHDRALPPSYMHLIVVLVIVAVPALLIVRQPDLGTALLVVAAGGLTILLAGISVRLIAGLSIAALVVSPMIWFYGLLDYQRDRLKMFLDPWEEAQGAGYNIIQSQIAIGSGGTYGKGWLLGTQAHLEFLPERSTDFIFAVLAEEFGLVGVVSLLILYLVLVGRGLYIAAQAQDTFTRLLAGSLSLTFFCYVFVNAGMVSGLLPVVGVPLPLVSAGGTSMVTLLAGFGMLSAISRHRKFIAP